MIVVLEKNLEYWHALVQAKFQKHPTLPKEVLLTKDTPLSTVKNTPIYELVGVTKVKNNSIPISIWPNKAETQRIMMFESHLL